MSGEVVQFTPWGSAHPMSIPQQVMTRVRVALDEKRDVAVFSVVAEKNERGNWCYTVTWSDHPGEVGLMAAYELKRRVMKEDK